MFCVVSMLFINSFWSGSFASVTARRFLIIVTLYTCVACTVVCDCFPFPSLCTGIRISISMNLMMHFGQRTDFRFLFSAAWGPGFRIPPPRLCSTVSIPSPLLCSTVRIPPPPCSALLCRTVFFYSYFFSHCIGSWALSLRGWDSQFEAIFSSLISSASMYCATALRCPNPDNIQFVIDRAKSCRSSCTKSRCSLSGDTHFFRMDTSLTKFLTFT